MPRSTAEVLTRRTAFAHAPASLMNCKQAVLGQAADHERTDFAALPDGGASEGPPTAWRRRPAGAALWPRSMLWPRPSGTPMPASGGWSSGLAGTAAGRDSRPGALRACTGHERRGAGGPPAADGEKLPSACRRQPAHAKKAGEEGRKLLSWRAAARTSHALCSPVVRPCGLDRPGPVVL